MFNHFPQSEVTIVAPDGTVRSAEKGILDSKQVTIQNVKAIINVGDEIRRKLPNGTEEAFEVVDPVYHERFHAIPAHYQVKIRRKGTFPAGTGGHFTFHLNGPNARVNFASHDQSQNITAGNDAFVKLKGRIESALPDSEERSCLLTLVDDMEKSTGDKPAFTSAYQRFIASAANHMTIIAPFLPTITNLLS
jgi:hypothetical protein